MLVVETYLYNYMQPKKKKRESLSKCVTHTHTIHNATQHPIIPKNNCVGRRVLWCGCVSLPSRWQYVRKGRKKGSKEERKKGKEGVAKWTLFSFSLSLTSWRVSRSLPEAQRSATDKALSCPAGPPSAPPPASPATNIRAPKYHRSLPLPLSLS